MTLQYELTGFYNLREGGGMASQDGRVRTLRLLRSDFPSEMTGEAQEFFRDVPVAGVIDLRSELEVLTAPPLFKEAGLHVYHRPVEAGSILSMLSGKLTVERMYMGMLEHAPEQLAKAVALAADITQDGAVLVHCTAGKDRTGIVIALIQSVLGVPDEEIVANYEITSKNLTGAWVQNKLEEGKKIAAKVPDGNKIDLDELIPLMTGSPASAMEAVLDKLQEDWGGPEGFLLHHGVTTEQMETLRKNLLAN